MDIYIERDGWIVQETQKGKSMELFFAWGLGFLLAIVVWCACPLRYPGTGQNQDRVQGSFISHSFPALMGLGVKVFGVSVATTLPSHSFVVTYRAGTLRR